MKTYRVTLWQGSFLVWADSEAEAISEAVMTVVEDGSHFQLAEEASEGEDDAPQVQDTLNPHIKPGYLRGSADEGTT
jgi:hypothetical protein